jgi:glycosyltransferase involved in cell wall biosynthesis
VTVSIVEPIWNLPGRLLDCNLATLTQQAEPPLEIIIVNASPDERLFASIEVVCKKYGVRMISAPYPTFNLSRNLNVGIRATEGEYVLLTAVDQLFPTSMMSEIYLRLVPGRVIQATRGDLPIGFDVGEPSTIVERWDELLKACIPPAKFPPGTIICAHREWLFSVGGFDETRCPYNYCDSDLLTRAQVDGIEMAIIGWDRAKILHMAHERNIPLYYMPSSMPDRSLPIVRNPNGWGQI